jgi:hypothetical protein
VVSNANYKTVYDLTASDLPRLKRPESEQRKPVWMAVTHHRFTRTFADPLAAPAAHEAKAPSLSARCEVSVRAVVRRVLTDFASSREMMAERGIEVDHPTVHRWVIKLVPLFAKTFRKYKQPLGKSWRMSYRAELIIPATVTV